VPYLQVELRVMAALSGDEALQAAFAKGQDVHAATAREMLGKGPQVLPVEEVAVCVCVRPFIQHCCWLTHTSVHHAVTASCSLAMMCSCSCSCHQHAGRAARWHLAV
jgi:hypothetical protein